MAQGCQLPVAVITGGRFGAPAEGPEILFALVQMVGGLVRAPFFDLVPQLTGDVRLQGQVSAQILSGALPPGTALPSIRALARDLKISVITTKRAYDELEAAGYLVTVAGKGSFVAEGNRALQREARLREMEEHLTKAIALGRECGLGTEELRESFALLLKEDAR